jgi:hypothetical protein
LQQSSSQQPILARYPAAGVERNHLCHQLHQAQQQLQQQQLLLSERNAQVAVLRSELAECQARASTVAAASSSAQSDFKVALARSNKLYSQELRHLQGLLQVIMSGCISKL